MAEDLIHCFQGKSFQMHEENILFPVFLILRKPYRQEGGTREKRIVPEFDEFCLFQYWIEPVCILFCWIFRNLAELL